MRSLSAVNDEVETMAARVRDYLATQEDVVAAYLFGSRAQGRARAHSDVDIAVLLREGLTSEERLFRRLSLGDALEQYLGQLARADQHGSLSQPDCA